MSDSFFFAAKSIGLARVNGRKPCSLLEAARHNKRTRKEGLAARNRIDGEQSERNFALIGPDDPGEIEAHAHVLLAATGNSHSTMRKDYVQAIEVVFSLPADTTIDARAYFAECVEWAGAKFGLENILSADVHHDESSPHCHALIAPVKDGKWVGGKLLDRKPYAELWQGFGKEVASRYGLNVGDKLRGHGHAEAVAAVLAALERAEGAIFASRVWQPIRKAIERDPAPFLQAMDIPKVEPKRKRMRTSTEIFTSRGKGSERESALEPRRSNPIGIDSADTSRAQSNPIGIDQSDPVPGTSIPIGIHGTGRSHQSLSCVGIAPFAPRSKPPPQAWPAPDRNQPDHLDASQSDPDPPAFDFPDDYDDPADAREVVIDDDGVITRVRDSVPDQPDAFDEVDACQS